MVAKDTEYWYEAYGLRMWSEVPLRFMPTSSRDDPDVEVRLGRTPEALPNAERRLEAWEASATGFLLRGNGVARYLVTDGRTIVVEPAGGANPALVEAFLAGSVMAALLQQRGVVTLHASAVQTHDGAVLFAGPSGSGKSTLLAALVARGYPMLADDVVGVVLDEHDRPIALRAYPRCRLWTPSLRRLGWCAGEATGEVIDGDAKQMVKVDRFGDARSPLHAVFVLQPQDHPGIEIERLTSGAAFEVLVRETHRRQFLCGSERLQRHFGIVAATAKQVQVAKVARPATAFLLDELADKIEQWLQIPYPAQLPRPHESKQDA